MHSRLRFLNSDTCLATADATSLPSANFISRNINWSWQYLHLDNCNEEYGGRIFCLFYKSFENPRSHRKIRVKPCTIFCAYVLDVKLQLYNIVSIYECVNRWKCERQKRAILKVRIWDNLKVYKLERMKVHK